MSGTNSHSRPLLGKLTRDPVALRRRSRVAAVVLAGLGALAGSEWPVAGGVATALMALVWFVVPLVASGIGVGDAFFLRHGEGQRRVTLTLLCGILVALVGCVVVSGASASENERPLLSGLLYFTLISAVIAVMASLVALGLGRGERHAPDRLRDFDSRG